MVCDGKLAVLFPRSFQFVGRILVRLEVKLGPISPKSLNRVFIETPCKGMNLTREEVGKLK